MSKPLVPSSTSHTTIMKSPETNQDVGAVMKPNVPDVFGNVVDFHKKFGIEYEGPPRDLPHELKVFRDETEGEEQREIRLAKDANQLADLLDGYVDYIYFVLGRCHLHGWDFNEAWRRVHEKNMTKVRASVGNPSKRSKAYGMNFDIVKPEGFTPPDLRDLVTIPKDKPMSLYQPETNLPDTKIT